MEPPQQSRTGINRVDEHLHGYVAPKMNVFCSVNDSHSSATDQTKDPILAKNKIRTGPVANHIRLKGRDQME
ncbi:MAG: hypothetical protein C0467_33450 [Planctomycetaceae bacterium]|nr:hypothetical protein [Planctomycetaceae bacterium]